MGQRVSNRWGVAEFIRIRVLSDKDDAWDHDEAVNKLRYDRPQLPATIHAGGERRPSYVPL